MANKQCMTRRSFLRMSALAALGAAIQACAQPTPQVVEKPVTVVVEKQVPVEKQIVQTVVVEKQVPVEKVVKETVIQKETVIVKETVIPPVKEEMSSVQELRVISGVINPADGLDPVSRFGYTGLKAVIWEQLLNANDAWEVRPAIAEKWEVSSDGLKYTFYLRKDAKFSDGSPLTAHEVAWSLRLLVSRGHPANYGKRGNYASIKVTGPYIKGADDIINGKVEWKDFTAFNVAGIQVVDDFAFTVEHTQAYPFFPGMLAQMFRVVHPDSVMKGAQREAEYTADEWWTVEKGCLYTGPFMLSSFRPGQGMDFVPNPHYYGPKPKLTKIVFTFASDASAAMTAFQNKEADVVAISLDAARLRSALNDPALQSAVSKSPQVSVWQFWLTPYPPLDDVHVRRAFSMAIDKAAMIKVLDGGLGIWYTTPGHYNDRVNPICPEAKKNVKPLPFDVAKAKQELEQSEYKDKIKDMEINICLAGAAPYPEAEIIQKMLQDNLGLTNVQIRPERIPDATKPPFPVHMWRNTQGDWFPEPANLVLNMISIMEIKEGGYGPGEVIPLVTPPYVPELIDLKNKALAATTAEEKCGLLGQIWQVWNDTVFSLDYGTCDTAILVAPWVNNFHMGFGNQMFPYVDPRIWEVWITKH